MTLATKQSLSYGVASYQEIASATKIIYFIEKFFYVPRNDAAVVRFALVEIAVGGVSLIRSNLPCNRHCEELREFSFFLINDFSDEAISYS